ncbi:hypothetical protein [Zooshikella ganghwensis]|uniref:hypothetical protein n=1 Tax=Zooshikella ganghwensis TaxID=202772 RepID=UPI0012F9F69E|nr:hypothetical protein [Zooshikella ganghwensis]
MKQINCHYCGGTGMISRSEPCPYCRSSNTKLKGSYCPHCHANLAIDEPHRPHCPNTTHHPLNRLYSSWY